MREPGCAGCRSAPRTPGTGRGRQRAGAAGAPESSPGHGAPPARVRRGRPGWAARRRRGCGLDHGGKDRRGPDVRKRRCLEAHQAECARSSAVVAGAALDDRARAAEVSFTLRYALAHMIQETARHCGHLDLLRESIDGQAGE
ncbi:DUF664 domain-containing protein [Micromonospora echinofusca]|uniref:mycothiol transferase n=1 Tax=Micromonospora echinofusca TaxID=47858 RepID=UPI00343F4C64